MISMRDMEKAHPIHILQIVGDPVGGIRKHVHSLLFGLNRTEYSLSYAYSSTATDNVFNKEIVGLEAILHGSLSLHVHKKPHINDLINLWKLCRYVFENHVDFVHGHGAKAGLYARLIGMVCHIPVFYTPHGGVVHNMFGYWQDRLYLSVERLLLKYTSCIVFVSHYSESAYISRIGKIPGKYRVNYNGIEPMPVETPANHEFGEKDKITIGVFGMLRPEKGQINLLKAVRAIVQAGRHNLVLHIFGDGPDRQRLEQEAALSEASSAIVFHGDVADTQEWMLRMDMVVHVSRCR